jgi:excisionase family DNA binding protein
MELTPENNANRKIVEKTPTYLTAKETAKLIAVRPRTIYEMVAQKRIPYCKPPGSNILRFDLDEILAWMKGGTKT